MFSMVKLQFEHWKNGTKYYSHSGVISSSHKKPHEAAFGEINLFRQYWLYWLNGLKPAFEQQNQVIP
ncbi:hypothetical protein FXE42_03990 [Vibrio cholerae]|nr:hypothetical protein FXE42_03990 [Vibrio cholerae]